MAVSDFKNGDYDAAVCKLEYASHFFADLCVPHHGDFEDFAQSMHHNYAVYTAAGSDDDIYFGMEPDNGSAVEYLLDKSGYNDFERDKTDTYALTCNDPQFPASSIANIWVRKKSLINDDWKFHSIAIIMNGTEVFYEAPDKWLYGSTTYKMPVNGL